jgi:site-specific recombinase XerD
VLSTYEHQVLLETYDRTTFEDLPDRAFLAVLAGAGLRFSAVLTMRLEDYDRVPGGFKVHEKGNEDRPVLVDGRARRHLDPRAALRRCGRTSLEARRNASSPSKTSTNCLSRSTDVEASPALRRA